MADFAKPPPPPPKPRSTRRKVKIPRGNRNNTKKSLYPNQQQQQQQQQQTSDDVYTKFEIYIRDRERKRNRNRNRNRNIGRERKRKRKTGSKTRSKTSTSSRSKTRSKTSTSSRSKTRRKTSTSSNSLSHSLSHSPSVLQAPPGFASLGIKEGDWMTDPCAVFNKIKTILNTETTGWTEHLLEQVDKIIPKLQRITQSKTSSKNIDSDSDSDSDSDPVYKYGDKTIQMGEEIGSGAYGTVKEGILRTSTDSRYIVIKHINSTVTLLQILAESIVQMELFCGLRGKFGTGARIPKTEFIAKYKSDSDSDSDTNYVIGMEPLDGDLFSFFSDSNISARNKIIAIKDIAEFLRILQTNYKFMHRDLHGANIMYKKMKKGKKAKETYKMYIIDFGFSTAVIEEQQINKKKNDIYREPHKFNPSQDLRTLLTSLLSQLVTKYHNTRTPRTLQEVDNPPNPYILMTLLVYASTLLRYIKTDYPTIHHNTYADMVSVHDYIFTPGAIIKTARHLLILPDDELETTDRTDRTSHKYNEALEYLIEHIRSNNKAFRDEKKLTLTARGKLKTHKDTSKSNPPRRHPLFNMFSIKDTPKRGPPRRLLFTIIYNLLSFYLGAIYKDKDKDNGPFKLLENAFSTPQHHHHTPRISPTHTSTHLSLL